MAGTMPKGTLIIGAERKRLALRLAQRYAAGETIRDLAAETGRSYGFIYSVLKEAGVPLRRRGSRIRRMRD